MYRRPRLLWRLLILGVLLAATACDTPLGVQSVPDEVVAPSSAGLITSAETRGDVHLVMLATGEELRVPVGATELYGLPGPGRVILFGSGGPATSDTDTWFAVLSQYGSGCYELPANGEVRGDRLATSLGFSVPLSDEWNETEDRFVDSPAVGFCQNDQGEAWRARPGSSA
jgi:hypothetical protein